MTSQRQYQSVNPSRTLATWRKELPEERQKFVDEVPGLLKRFSLIELRDENAKWHREPMAVKPIALLWLINQEFTRRGIGPQWRGLPVFVSTATMPLMRLDHFPATAGAVPIGDQAQHARLLRWIDLEWLATALGTSHVPDYTPWGLLFTKGLDSQIANQIANSRERQHFVVQKLAIPKAHRCALKGLMPKDEGLRADTLRKRLSERYRPLLEARLQARLHPLTREQVESRVAWCEAIELAHGAAADAARIFGWITGVSVTRQTAHEMRSKIAKQLKLRSAAWTGKLRRST